VAGPIQESDRITAAQQTVSTNPLCSPLTLRSGYYWEVGDGTGSKVSGTVAGTDSPTGTTEMWIFSSSKWLYASSVLQKRNGVLDANNDVPYLNFTSGYSDYGNAPICLDSSTVDSCFIGHDGRQNSSTIGRFAYDSGHLQHHASVIMNMGEFDGGALTSDVNAQIGNVVAGYELPQLAAGVRATPQAYASFLRRLLRNELFMGAQLGTHKVCAQSQASGCNAAYTPDSIGGEVWSYSLGHWVEDDPVVGDRAFSSAGGGGFYPWIDAGKDYYGIVARHSTLESAAGYHSAQCGRLIRQAWLTGKVV